MKLSPRRDRKVFISEPAHRELRRMAIENGRTLGAQVEQLIARARKSEAAPATASAVTSDAQ